MASRVGNFYAENYRNPIIGFHVTVKTVGDDFLGHSVVVVVVVGVKITLLGEICTFTSAF